MYGSWDANSTPLVSAGTAIMPSDVPFGGTGRLQTFTYPGGTPSVAGQDEFNLVNYTFFSPDGFTHDPARYGLRSSPSVRPHHPLYGRTKPPVYLSRSEQYVSGDD